MSVTIDDTTQSGYKPFLKTRITLADNYIFSTDFLKYSLAEFFLSLKWKNIEIMTNKLFCKKKDLVIIVRLSLAVYLCLLYF